MGVLLSRVRLDTDDRLVEVNICVLDCGGGDML